MPPITPLFAAIFALFYLYLSFDVIRYRFKGKISIGDGGNKDLQLATRVHANFIEYVPLALILMWGIELVIYDSRLAYVLGMVLLIGRVLHVVGMHHPKNFLICRQIGTLATFAVLLLAALRLIWHYLPYYFGS